MNYSRAGLLVHLSRIRLPFVLTWYLPSAVLVVVSWISFLVPAELVPGRMALLVTIFLMLVNVSTSYQEKSPETNNSLTALDIWQEMRVDGIAVYVLELYYMPLLSRIIACMLFVAATLFEYAWMLKLRFGSGGEKGSQKQSVGLRRAKCRFDHFYLHVLIGFTTVLLHFCLKDYRSLGLQIVFGLVRRLRSYVLDLLRCQQAEGLQRCNQ